MEQRHGPTKYYNGRYFLAFYDSSDEHLLYTFDNVKEILRFQKKEISRKNVHLVDKALCIALRRDKHQCEFLTGSQMRVYLVDLNEED